MAKHVVCAVSGSIDSVIAASLLKQRGHHVTALFLSHEKYQDRSVGEHQQIAADVCKHVDVPFRVLTLTSDDEKQLYKSILDDYRKGLTPDLDMLYTKHVLFGAALDHIRTSLGASAFATGHYARVVESIPESAPDDPGPQGPWGVKLLKGIDQGNDDSWHLSQLPQEALQKVLFPLGEFNRETVKMVAQSMGLEKFYDTNLGPAPSETVVKMLRKDILQDLPSRTGRFIHLETSQGLGIHSGTHEWAIGDKVTLGTEQFYVVDKNLETNDVTLAQGADHPALYCENMFLSLANWVHRLPYHFYRKQMMNCTFRLHGNHAPVPCTLTVGMPTPWCGNDHIILSSSQALRAVTPGRYGVFYQGEECLGSAKILRSGPSKYAMNYQRYKSTEPQKQTSMFGSFLKSLKIS